MYPARRDLIPFTDSHHQPTPIHRCRTQCRQETIVDRYDRRWLSRYGSLHSHFEARCGSVDRKCGVPDTGGVGKTTHSGKKQCRCAKHLRSDGSWIYGFKFCLSWVGPRDFRRTRYETCRTNGVGNFFLPR